jgi:hypothetical protein
VNRVLAYFFLIIFSFQALPVKAIGKLLSKSQLTEEVKGDCQDTDDTNDTDDSGDLDDYDDGDENPLKEMIFDHIANEKFLPYTLILNNSWHHHADDDLPNSHTKDIHCPPPNC